ncbi:TetR/AcrR family transcriptional regulator [Promicromonospora citrea]|uniref:TetR family transcriptional regulator n=1 Tax=Promicromonospora citrea TaxID=43677 RepID=A0A8H9GK60_9MICO|nr:TetR/AcrR family transcriptional regulator [Promicromonospora citrea]NNH51056.1 TetR family transcriptional regulator [Promicromonospora citrea]GGM29925.1 TetR family transcriptional regulator [Promicromonospora citrea]
MARWQPGTRGRLQDAALDLFVSRGYEQTTAADIAAAVGLTERTFFRHFADKREVLFDGQEMLGAAFLRGIDESPDGATPWELIEAAIASAATVFTDEMRPRSRRRQTVIDQHSALQEREQHKMSHVAAEIRDALHARGVEETAARLAAESASTAFAVAFAQWLRDGEERPLTEIASAVLAELRRLATPAG